MSLPRTRCISRSGSFRRSPLPSSNTSPPRIFPGGVGINRKIDSAERLFPDPLSPTIASVWPGKIENETSRTGTISRCSVVKATERLRTSRSGRGFVMTVPTRQFVLVRLASFHSSQPRVQGIARCFADQVVRENSQEDGQARKNRQPPHEPAACADGFVEQLTPTRVADRNAEAEEAQRALCQNRAGNIEARAHEQRRQRVGEQMSKQNRPQRQSARDGSLDEIEIAQAQEFGAHEARVARPTR